MKKQILTALVMSLGCATVANAATLFDEDFSHLTPAPGPGGWSNLTGTITSDHTYTIGSTDGVGNFDVVDDTHVAGICAPGAARCLDIDGTGAGSNSYFYTGPIAVQANTTYQMSVLVGGNRRNDNPDNLIFGFMDANTNDAILNGYRTVSNFGRNEAFQTLTFNYTTGSETSLKLFVQNWTSDPTHPERTLYQGMPAPDDYGPMLQSLSLTAVPLPAAAWLLLSGLAGVGVFARRRRTAIIATAPPAAPR